MNILAAVVCSSWRDQSLWPVFRDLLSSLKRVSLCRRAVSPWRPRRPWTAQAEVWRNLLRPSGTRNRLWPETRGRIWAAPTARPGKCQRTWKRGRQRRVLLLTWQSRRVPRVWRDPKQPETTVKTWPCAGTVPEPQTLWMFYFSLRVNQVSLIGLFQNTLVWSGKPSGRRAVSDTRQPQICPGIPQDHQEAHGLLYHQRQTHQQPVRITS